MNTTANTTNTQFPAPTAVCLVAPPTTAAATSITDAWATACPPPAAPRSPNAAGNRRSSRTRGLIAGGAILGASLVLLAACGLPGTAIVVERGDSGRNDRHTTETTVPETIAPETTAPESTVPETTVPDQNTPPISLPIPDVTVVTDLPTTIPTVEVELPAGAVELGAGVFVVPSAGWAVTAAEGVVQLTEGSVDVSAQVLRRMPGEDPKVLLDEYVATFDTDFEAVSYTPARLTWTADTPRPAMEYDLFYSTFDGAVPGGRGLAGGISMFVRDDGLSLLIDTWASAAVTGSLPVESFTTLLDSFLAAPSAATAVALNAVADFRVATIHDPAIVTGFDGFTPAPGFEVLVEGDRVASVTNGVTDLNVVRIGDATDSVDALGRVQQLVLDIYPDSSFSNEVIDTADRFGVVHHGMGWTGTYEGAPRSGGIDVFFDTTTGVAYAISMIWAAEVGQTQPDVAATSFMYTSMVTSFENIA